MFQNLHQNILKLICGNLGGPLGPGGDIVTFGDDLGTRWGDLGQFGDALG